MLISQIDDLYHFIYISSMLAIEKPLEWVGSSHKDLMALPADVRRLFGFALSLAQAGDRHDAAKVLKGFGGAGVLEVVEDDKSKCGIATPKEDMDIIHARLKIAEAYAKGLRK
jgi:phage-related protein